MDCWHSIHMRLSASASRGSANSHKVHGNLWGTTGDSVRMVGKPFINVFDPPGPTPKEI